jgi:kinesin family protein 5
LEPEQVNLQIKEDKLKGIFIQNLTEVYVDSAEKMLEILKIGSQNRSQCQTKMNDSSSRSHSLYLINIHQKNNLSGVVKLSKLFVVDLAGSEKLENMINQQNQLQEVKNINKSLTYLGIVINCLLEKRDHIPYRDSKLTRIL